MTEPYTYHPLTGMFPLLEGPAFDAMVADIRAHGLREPVVVDPKGVVIDGRNRARACGEAGVPIVTRVFAGDVRAFVISENVQRRHLDTSQRAIIAARMAPLSKGGDPAKRSPDILTQDEAATLLNVSVPTVKRAKVVLDKGIPELAAAVERGEVDVTVAARIARLPAEKQLGRIQRDGRKANGTARQADDFYRTPAAAVAALLDAEKFPGTVWEPACGDGAISRVLIAKGYSVISTDLVDRGYGEAPVDFLAQRQRRGALSMVTNPPFALDDQFALHALELGFQRIALFGRLVWLEGAQRFDELWMREKLARVWVFSERQTLWRGDDEHPETDGGMTAYAWFVFDADHSGGWSGDWL